MVIRAVALSMVIGCMPILIAETAIAMDSGRQPVASPSKFDIIQQDIDILETRLLKLQTEQSAMKIEVVGSGPPEVQKSPTIINPKYIIFDNTKIRKSDLYGEDLGLKRRNQSGMHDQDSSQMQQSVDVEPWNPQGYEQSVRRAKRTYRTEERAKCSKKLYYYTTKYEMHPKNEYYKYKLDYWLKKCK